MQNLIALPFFLLCVCVVPALTQLTPSVAIIPPYLNFQERAVCIPAVQTIDVINTSDNADLLLISVSIDDLQFHPQHFKQTHVGPKNKTSLPLIFLPRFLGPIEASLVIQTNVGGFLYQIHAYGVANPYRVAPLLGIKIQEGALFNPFLSLYNPHEEILHVKEIFANEDFLHLNLPSSPPSPTNELQPSGLWHIRAQQSKNIIAVEFTSLFPGQFHGFVHIKTDRDDMIVPVEILVVKDKEHEDGQLDRDYQGRLLFSAYNVSREQDEAILSSISTLHAAKLGAINNTGDTSFSERTPVLDLGVQAVNETRSEAFNLTNPNTFQLMIISVTCSLPFASVHLDTVWNERNHIIKIFPRTSENAGPSVAEPNPKKTYSVIPPPAMSKEKEKEKEAMGGGGRKSPAPSSSCKDCGQGVLGGARPALVTLDASQSCLFMVSVVTPPSMSVMEEMVSGDIVVQTNFQRLVIGVRYFPVSGSITMLPRFVRINASFPGCVLRQSVIAKSTLSQATSIRSVVSSDPRFSFLIANATLPASSKTLLGYVIFDPSQAPSELDYMSNRAFQDKRPNPPDKGNRVPAPEKGSPSPKPSATVSPLNSMSLSTSYAEMLGHVAVRPDILSSDDLLVLQQRDMTWNGLVAKGLTSLRASLTISTEAVSGITVPVRASLTRPAIALTLVLNFSLIQVGTRASRTVRVHNPSDAPLQVQIMPMASPTPTFKYPLYSYTPSPAFYCGSESSNNPCRLLSAWTTADRASWFFISSSSLSPRIIPPHSDADIGHVHFSPRSAHLASAFLYIKNNLTIVDVVTLKGEGGGGHLMLYPPSSTPIMSAPLTEQHEWLRFDMNVSMLGTGLPPSAKARPAFVPFAAADMVLTRVFMAVNRGNMPIHVRSFSVGGRGCSAYGFAINNCSSFSLGAGESVPVSISFRPNFAAAIVTRELFITTSTGVLSFPLVGTVPHELLPLCIESHRWPRSIRFGVTGVVLFVFALLARMAIHDFYAPPTSPPAWPVRILATLKRPFAPLLRRSRPLRRHTARPIPVHAPPSRRPGHNQPTSSRTTASIPSPSASASPSPSPHVAVAPPSPHSPTTPSKRGVGILSAVFGWRSSSSASSSSSSSSSSPPAFSLSSSTVTSKSDSPRSTKSATTPRAVGDISIKPKSADKSRGFGQRHNNHRGHSVQTYSQASSPKGNGHTHDGKRAVKITDSPTNQPSPTPASASASASHSSIGVPSPRRTSSKSHPHSHPNPNPQTPPSSSKAAASTSASASATRMETLVKSNSTTDVPATPCPCPFLQQQQQRDASPSPPISPMTEMELDPSASARAHISTRMHNLLFQESDTEAEAEAGSGTEDPSSPQVQHLYQSSSRPEHTHSPPHPASPIRSPSPSASTSPCPIVSPFPLQRKAFRPLAPLPPTDATSPSASALALQLLLSTSPAAASLPSASASRPFRPASFIEAVKGGSGTGSASGSAQRNGNEAVAPAPVHVAVAVAPAALQSQSNANANAHAPLQPATPNGESHEQHQQQPDTPPHQHQQQQSRSPPPPSSSTSTWSSPSSSPKDWSPKEWSSGPPTPLVIGAGGEVSVSPCANMPVPMPMSMPDQHLASFFAPTNPNAIPAIPMAVPEPVPMPRTPIQAHAPVPPNPSAVIFRRVYANPMPNANPNPQTPPPGHRSYPFPQHTQGLDFGALLPLPLPLPPTSHPHTPIGPLDLHHTPPPGPGPVTPTSSASTDSLFFSNDLAATAAASMSMSTFAKDAHSLWSSPTIWSSLPLPMPLPLWSSPSLVQEQVHTQAALGLNNDRIVPEEEMFPFPGKKLIYRTSS